MELTPEMVLNAYCNACFPMGEEGSDEISWYRPDPRTIIPLDSFHIPRSLKRILNRRDYEVRFNTRFRDVIRYCRDRHQGIWISDKILEVYEKLHETGFAHSLEIFKENELAGGLYGVAIGGAFFGESMFYLKTNCSKIALCELVAWMRQKKMQLLDTQFPTPHLARFNIQMIPDADYFKLLQKAIRAKVSFA